MVILWLLGLSSAKITTARFLSFNYRVDHITCYVSSDEDKIVEVLTSGDTDVGKLWTNLFMTCFYFYLIQMIIGIVGIYSKIWAIIYIVMDLGFLIVFSCFRFTKPGMLCAGHYTESNQDRLLYPLYDEGTTMINLMFGNGITMIVYTLLVSYWLMRKE